MSTEHHPGQSVFTWDMVNLALRAAEEGFYLWDLQTDKIHYTDRCLKMMGVGQNEEALNIFKHPELTVHEDDRSFFKNELRRYLEGYTPLPMRIELRLLDQQSRAWRWIRVNGKAVRDDQHRALKLVGVWVDISRRKTAEMRAAEESELFRTLINNIPDNVYFKNRESRFVRANTATAEKLGVPTPSDLIGRTDASFFGDEMSQISRAEELEIMRTGKPRIASIHREIWKDHEDTWSKIAKYPWYSSLGHLQGTFGISSDVTQLVKAEREIRESASIIDQRNKSLEKELDLAREIQLALLPYTIPTRTWENDRVRRQAEFYHIFAPSEGVAGDCFEVFPVGETGVGAIVCDVMGHGIRAALIASMLRGLMEQIRKQANDPAKFLSSLNLQLTRILTRANTTMFASALYMYMDLSTGELTLSTAGHPEPILFTPDAVATMPKLPRSMAMGLLEDAPYYNTVLTILPGTQMMMYTDGLTEAANAEGEELGHQRVMARFEEVKPKDVKTLIMTALKCAGKFTGCSQLADDICMLGMRFDEQRIKKP